jgi:hypothetical protein
MATTNIPHIAYKVMDSVHIRRAAQRGPFSAHESIITECAKKIHTTGTSRLVEKGVLETRQQDSFFSPKHRNHNDGNMLGVVVVVVVVPVVDQLDRSKGFAN